MYSLRKNICKQLVRNISQSNQHLKVFEENSSKWWKGKEFQILRSMNEIRVPFIVNGLDKQLDKVKLLDVGCGGGILSEPLARLGANVLGIDPVFNSINEAQLHSQDEVDLSGRLKYRNCNIEDLSAQVEHIEAYDGVIASEVLEHVEDVESMLLHCTNVLKPNGSLFITTINQTPLSWLGVVLFGEYILKQLPKGTHTYDMFVSVKGLRTMLERMGYHIHLINGFMYEPVGGKFYWTPSTLTHYALHAVKVGPKEAKTRETETAYKLHNFQQRRYLAKPKNRPKTPLEPMEMMKVIPYDIYESKANAIVTDFRENLQNNVTTRATTNSIERIRVEIEGLNESLELRDVAQISMRGNVIVINLTSMPEAVKPTLNKLIESGNLNPQVEVNNIFIPIPRVTREVRENLVSVAKKSANVSKDKLKALFSDFSSKAKRLKTEKGSGISLDLIHSVVENLQFDVNKRIAEIEVGLEKKVSQLLNEKN